MRQRRKGRAARLPQRNVDPSAQDVREHYQLDLPSPHAVPPAATDVRCARRSSACRSVILQLPRDWMERHAAFSAAKRTACVCSRNRNRPRLPTRSVLMDANGKSVTHQQTQTQLQAESGHAGAVHQEHAAHLRAAPLELFHCRLSQLGCPHALIFLAQGFALQPRSALRSERQGSPNEAEETSGIT